MGEQKPEGEQDEQQLNHLSADSNNKRKGPIVSADSNNDAEPKRQRLEQNESFSNPFPSPSFLGVEAPTSKRISIPNGKVGVVIGKGWKTMEYIQMQSGAKIQIIKDPDSLTREVELTVTSDQISRAEELINDLVSETDAGGSGSSSNGTTEQIEAAEESVIEVSSGSDAGGPGSSAAQGLSANQSSNDTTEQIEAAEESVNEVSTRSDAGGSGSSAAQGLSANQSGGGEQYAVTVPNDEVGLLIGEGGETITYIHGESGARMQVGVVIGEGGETIKYIQITEDPEVDPHSLTREVELTGSSDEISKAEELVNDAVSVSDAGGSGLSAAQGLSANQSGGGAQYAVTVPNDTIIHLHLHGTVYINGTTEQIEAAKELVNEVISGSDAGGSGSSAAQGLSANQSSNDTTELIEAAEESVNEVTSGSDAGGSGSSAAQGLIANQSSNDTTEQTEAAEESVNESDAGGSDSSAAQGSSANQSDTIEQIEATKESVNEVISGKRLITPSVPPNTYALQAYAAPTNWTQQGGQPQMQHPPQYGYPPPQVAAGYGGYYAQQPGYGYNNQTPVPANMSSQTPGTGPANSSQATSHVPAYAQYPPYSQQPMSTPQAYWGPPPIYAGHPPYPQYHYSQPMNAPQAYWGPPPIFVGGQPAYPQFLYSQPMNTPQAYWGPGYVQSGYL